MTLELLPTLEQDKSLKDYNSFGFEQRAEYFAQAHSDNDIEQLTQLARSKHWPLLILGGGSNLVLTRNIRGLVVHMAGQQLEFSAGSSSGSVRVSAQAGVNWHELVLQTLRNNAPGLENLSLIPGSVGAAPVQNIGAYGVEVKDRIHSVHALHLPSQRWMELSASDCEFSYRNSLFKRSAGDYVISKVIFELGQQHKPDASYASLADRLALSGIKYPSPTDVSQAVIAVRQSRLPDPAVTGNAGSFFHNPIVPDEQAAALKRRFPDLVSFDAGFGKTKLSAGWLIDQLGYKGMQQDGVGVYDKQALVLVNLGSGTGEKLLELASSIQEAVASSYGVTLAIEPTVI